MAEKTITIKKDMIWKVATVLFAVLFVVSLFTGGFGIGGHAVADDENTLLNCVSDYGLNEDTIIFFYSESCSWCAKMKPGVQSLIDKGYDIYMANANEGGALITDCVLNYITERGVPQFICVKTGEIKVGAFVDAERNLDQTAMDAWVDSCLAG
jgi:hypothetical protein